jgi:predicted chitinase
LPIDSLVQHPPVAAFDIAMPDSTRAASLASATSSAPPMASDSIAIANPTHQDGLRNFATAAPVDPKRRAELVDKLVAQVPPGDRESAKKALPAILNAARQNGVTDPNQIGYMLATALHESDMGAVMTERGKASVLDSRYAHEDGNTHAHDGSRYRGRGYVQTTHEGRYAAMSKRLGLGNDLVAHPEKLTQPGLAARALVIGIKENLYTQNRAAALDKTIPAGHAPGDVDFVKARGIVNGGGDKAGLIARSATKFAQILDGYRSSVLGAPEAK